MKIGIILMFLIASVLSGCSKSVESPVVVPADNSFTWTYRGSTYTADTHIANLYSMAPKPIIVAYNKTNVPFPNYKLGISVISFSVGTYTLTSGTNGRNTFYYVDNDGHELVCTKGTLTITSNSNKLITGSFSATVTDPFKITRSIVGNFTNTPIEL